jgi:hypothetical protein
MKFITIFGLLSVKKRIINPNKICVLCFSQGTRIESSPLSKQIGRQFVMVQWNTLYSTYFGFFQKKNSKMNHSSKQFLAHEWLMGWTKLSYCNLMKVNFT